MANINDIVLSKNYILDLYKIGYRPENTIFCWTNLYSGNGTYTLYETDSLTINDYNKKDDNENYIFVPTLTLQEIINIFPYSIYDDFYQFYTVNIDMHDYSIFYGRKNDDVEDNGIYPHIEANFDGSNLLEASFKLLKWCINKGYIKRNIETEYTTY